MGTAVLSFSHDRKKWGLTAQCMIMSKMTCDGAVRECYDKSPWEGPDVGHVCRETDGLMNIHVNNDMTLPSPRPLRISRVGGQ